MPDEIRPVTPDADRARLIAELEDAKRHERHRTRQETMYWLHQYKSLAIRAADLLTTEGNTERCAFQNGFYAGANLAGALSEEECWWDYKHPLPAPPRGGR